jgi:hypothetical protein
MKDETGQTVPVTTGEEDVNALRLEVASLKEQVSQLSRSTIRSTVLNGPWDDEEAISRNPERISDQIITERVRAAVKARGFSVKRVAAITGLSQDQVYDRFKEVVPFRIREIDRLARAIDAPSSWPFKPWDLSCAIDDLLMGKPTPPITNG